MTLDEIRQKLYSFEQLTASEAWKELESTVRSQIEMRRVGIFSSQVTGLDGCFDLVRQQGEVSGMFLPFHLVEQRIRSLRADMTAKLEEEREQEARNE